MKKDTHPEEYREIVFEDASAEKRFLTRSTLTTEKTTTWEDGKEYPLYTLAISSYSHPFYTGSQRLVDSEGRIDKFRKKYARKGAGK